MDSVEMEQLSAEQETATLVPAIPTQATSLQMANAALFLLVTKHVPALSLEIVARFQGFAATRQIIVLRETVTVALAVVFPFPALQPLQHQQAHQQL